MEVDFTYSPMYLRTRDVYFRYVKYSSNYRKRQLEFAIRKRIQKVVLYTGLAAGVLKEELHFLFGRYDKC